MEQVVEGGESQWRWGGGRRGAAGWRSKGTVIGVLPGDGN